MLYDILHEVGVHELHDAQQAFLQSRDFLQNTTKLLRFSGTRSPKMRERTERGETRKMMRVRKGKKRRKGDKRKKRGQR